MLFELARQQVLLRNLDFLTTQVTGQLNNFHTVTQRTWDFIQAVRRSYEHDLRKVKRHIQEQIQEGVILRWIQNFQQCTGWIAAEIFAELVYFIQHNDWIIGAGTTHHLQHPTRHGADVRSAVPLDFGFIAHAAEAHAFEFAAH